MHTVDDTLVNVCDSLCNQTYKAPQMEKSQIIMLTELNDRRKRVTLRQVEGDLALGIRA